MNGMLSRRPSSCWIWPGLSVGHLRESLALRADHATNKRPSTCRSTRSAPWVNIARFLRFNRDQKAREGIFGYGELTSAHGTQESDLDPHNTQHATPGAAALGLPCVEKKVS